MQDMLRGGVVPSEITEGELAEAFSSSPDFAAALVAEARRLRAAHTLSPTAHPPGPALLHAAGKSAHSRQQTVQHDQNARLSVLLRAGTYVQPIASALKDGAVAVRDAFFGPAVVSAQRAASSADFETVLDVHRLSRAQVSLICAHVLHRGV